MTGTEFHFLRPLWLLLLLPLILLAWQLFRRGASDAGAWRPVVDAHLLRRLLDHGGAAPARSAPWLLAVGWVVLVVALAGPTWQRLPQPVYQTPYHRVVLLDLSLPMNATDLAPSRLARARFKAIDLLRQVADSQSALIAYGAEPYLVAPLTGDAATIVAQVPLLETSLLPVTGSARPDLALAMAGELLRQAGAGTGEVIMIGHAAGETGRSVAAARQLAEAGHRVAVLGVGTAAGAPIPLPNGGFVKDPGGGIVISRLDSGGLARVAEAGEGRYLAITAGGADTAALRPEVSPRMAADALRQDAQSEQWREEGPWLLLLLLPLAALAFRRGWLSPPMLLMAVVLQAPTEPVFAATWADIWSRPDQQAMRQLEAGDASAAAVLFERPDWRAAAAYRAGDYERTLDSLEQLEADAAPYNRGNALARLGRLEQAIDAYEQALVLDPNDEDARHNRDLLRALIESQREAEAPAQPDSEPDDAASDPAPSSDQANTDADEASETAQDDGEPGDTGRQDAAAAQSAASDGEESSGQDESEAQTQPGERPGQDAAAAADDVAQAGSNPSGDDPNASDADDGDTNGGRAGPRAEQGAMEGSEDTNGADDNGSERPGDAVDGAQRQQADAAARGDGGQVPRPDTAPRDNPDAAGAEGMDDSDQGDRIVDEPQHGGKQDATGGSQQQAQGPEHAEDEPGQGAAPDGPALGDAAPTLRQGDAPRLSDLTGGTRPSPEVGDDRPGTPRVAGGTLEREQAIEQQLRRVDEDPGGLLRQRFLLQHLRRNGQLR